MKARRLKHGDTIGIICPASPEDSTVIKQHIENLKKLGFKIKEGRHLYDKHGYLAGTDENRAADIIDMFIDNEVNAVMCYRGGYGTMRLLPLIDFDILKRHPKIFIGYSDITTLLNHMAEKCSLITFHGPMAGSDFGDSCTLESFLHALTGGNKPYRIKNPLQFQETYYGDSVTEGILAGGNLSLICSTLGTPYEIKTKDKILFIEEVGETPYRIDRMLTQLLLAGSLQRCKGFILGQFTDCSTENQDRSLSLQEVLADRLLSLNKPTIVNFMSGHDYPKLTLPIGAKVRIDCRNKEFEVLEAVVK
jgi:muramoyltetrapeptide carboxypeptidase